MPELTLDRGVAPGSPEYGLLVVLELFGRGMDLLSTWVATPTLQLEANPIARRLGWKGGLLISLGVALITGCLPIAAISIATTSVLVAARNFQNAWIIRSMGELEYRAWLRARYLAAQPGVFRLCLVLQCALLALPGIALMMFSAGRLVPFAVGFGVLVYALAVLVFTGRAMRRVAHLFPGDSAGTP